MVLRELTPELGVLRVAQVRVSAAGASAKEICREAVALEMVSADSAVARAG